MNTLGKNHLLIPLTLILALLAALLLATPAFAEEGALESEPPAGDGQGAAPAEEASAAPSTEEPTSAAPVVETPSESDPEAPVEDLPVEEPPAESEPETPAPASFSAPAAVQETDEQQVTSQYAGLPDNVYFYTNANVAKGYSDIDDAINNFVTESGKGMIYVSNRTVYTDPYNINGVTNLTGIVFLDYYPTEATKYDATSFNYYDPSDWAEIRNTVTITNMPTFTLLGFNITADNATQVVMINNDSGVTGTLNLSYLNILNEGNGAGLQIDNHTGSVTISNVISRSAGGRGASIGGGSPIAGAVNVTNSGFNNNGITGLEIQATGLTTLNGVTAGSNQRQGVYLKGRGAVVKNSVFSNNGLSAINGYGFHYEQNGAGNLTFENVQFNDNHEYGLYSYQVYGNVSLKNVRADGNGYRGAYMDTCHWNGTICQNPNSGNVTITSSNFANNGHISGIGHGLYVEAKGSIALTSVWAGENGDGGISASGAYLDNLHSPTKSPITITDGGFSFNTYEGLYARSMGAITLKDVSASNNQGGSYGAQLNNAQNGSTAGVTILNTSGRQNNFDGNQGNSAGLMIYSYGSIVMNWVTASNNRVHGASITNDYENRAGNVTLRYGHFNNNQGGYGLRIDSKGNISVTLTDCGVSDNASYGVFLYNSLAATAKTVTLDGGGYFNNGDIAIDIRSKGTVTVKNVDVGDTHNGNHGLNIINNTSPTNASVTVTATRSGWTNQFNRNEGYGMYIQSKGTITINRTNAGENYGYGAYLVNTGVTGNVSVTSSHFNDNAKTSDVYGLYISSNGNVSLNTVGASDNGESGTTDNTSGVFINNSGAGTPKPVSITSGWFNGNTNIGLYVTSVGAISLTNVYAENNLGNGAYLDNSGANTPLAVSVKGGEFNYNEGSRGLYISSKGAVTVSNAQAHNNPNGNGLEIYNNWGSAVGNVSVTCSSGTCAFSNNFAIGVAIYSKGSITLGRLDAQNNGTGATIDNTGTTLLNKNVSISNSYFSNSTSTWGLSVASNGSIALTNVDSGNNATFGATLNNITSTNGAGITLSGSGDWDWFGGNGTFGLEILSKGKVAISKISASENDQHGMRIVNTSASADQPVSITNADISRNVNEVSTYPYGLLVESKGIITLTNVWVNENGDDGGGGIRVNSGASLSNTSSNKTPGVTLTNVYFNDNYGSGGRQNSDNGNGLEVFSDGAITIKNMEATGNSGYGAKLSNMDGDGINTGGISITRTGTFTNHFDRNGDTGLYARSNGAITLSNLNVDDNGNEAGDFGVYLINNDDEDSTASMVKVSYTTISNSGEYVDPDYLGTGGLGIFAKGVVILNTVDASSNIGYGIRIDNTYLPNQNVSLTSVSTFVNSHRGLDVNTTGNVTGSGLTSVANGNQGTHNGATITTNGGMAGYGSITLSGTSFFGNNTGNGLQVSIANFGNLSLGGVTAEKNRAAGVLASVNHVTNAGTVTITKSNVNFNAQIGLGISARNSVLLNGIYALNNGTDGDGTTDYDGVLITQNNSGVTNTIQNCVLHGNTGSGLDIERNGSSTVITNTSYFGNNINNDGNELDVYLH